MAVDIKKPLKKMMPFLLQAQANNLNEADTVLRLVKFFEDVLGWDPMTEISRETSMKGKFVDVVLKLDGVIKLLIEAKAAGEKLRDRHVEQAELYASENNYHWVVLTNGVVWNLYHLTFEDGINYEKAFSIDLADPDRLDDAIEKLTILHRDSIRRNEHEAFWTKAVALSAASIGRALFEEPVLSLIRREIHRDNGALIDIEDLSVAIHDLLSDDAREKIGPVKVRKRPKARPEPKGSAEALAANTAPTDAEPGASTPDKA